MDSAVARRIARELALVNSRAVGPHVFHGNTMLPFLVDGDEVEIEPVGFDQIEPGDIVTYRDQQYFPTRRVIRIDRRSRSLIMKGDAIPHLTFFVLEEDVLGRATAIVRDGKRTAASDPDWRESASTIVARERRRARTAWLPDWLGLGPDDTGVPPPAVSVGGPTIGDPWWRTGRAAVDLDALQVMLALLAGAPERAVSVLERMKPRRFLDFARENGIAGDLVSLAQDQGGGVSAVFDPILAELIESARKQRAINRAVVAHLHEVAEIFSARGIEWILLKGPHLSLRYYGSLDQRRMGDLDLLVRRRDLRAASGALVAAGYASRTGAPLGMAALRFVHHVEHEKDGVPVDLHHQIRVHPTFRFDEEAMWRTAGSLDLGGRTVDLEGRTVDLGGLTVRVLSDEYVLVTLLLSIHNDVGLGTADLHAFFDLDRVLARAGTSLDWEGFFAARRRERTDLIAANVLAFHLVLMGGGERHPALLRMLEARRSELATEPDRRAYVELIQGASLAVKKRWAFAQLATSLPAATLWWLVGLPVHALVYRRIFFRNFGQRLALRRRAKAERRTRTPNVVHVVEPAAPGPTGPLAAFGVDAGALPTSELRPMRLGSLTLELRCDRTFAPDTLEELFRLEGTHDDAAAAARAGTPDVRVHVFDATLEELHRLVPPPIRSVVRRDLEGIFEVHHQAASAIVVRPRAAGPVEVLLPLRPTSAESATRDTATTPDQMLVHSLMIVFYRMLFELGVLHLHAAAVEHGGATSLFLGGKGAGKSTLCLALARAGATVLGEDHVLVRRCDGQLAGGFVVSGCDANMRLTAQTEEALLPQPPSGRKALFGGVLKREFDLRQTSFAIRPFTDSTPNRIFFPVVGSRVAIAPMPRARAMTRILGAIHDRHAIAGAGDARRLLEYVGALVDSLETYELELSPRLSDLDAVVDFVAGRSVAGYSVAAGGGAGAHSAGQS